MNEGKNKFEYTYSALTEEERAEIESIRRGYLSPEPGGDGGKLARLRKLNARVKNAAVCAGLTAGIVGVLLFGAGMSLSLSFSRYAAGIVLSLVGILPMAAAMPLYKFVLGRGRKKYGEEILRLSEELLNERK